MTTVALLLALGICIAPGTASIRGRAFGTSPSTRVRHELLCAADPLAAAATFDVLAACLAAGMSVPAAAAAAAPSAPPQLGAVLRRAADLLALGADPGSAWSVPGGSDDRACNALMRLARRSAASGTALAQGLAELAEQSRQEATHEASAAAERAGVLIAGPLGLCFLPAFVCVGIVPVVIGLAGDVFTVGPVW